MKRPFLGCLMSSGQLQQWSTNYFAHTCGWQGMGDFCFDPEHSTSTVTITCPGCHEVSEIPLKEW